MTSSFLVPYTVVQGGDGWGVLRTTAAVQRRQLRDLDLQID